MPRPGTEDLGSIKTTIEIMGGNIDDLYNLNDDTSQTLKMVGKLQPLVELKDNQIEALEKHVYNIHRRLFDHSSATQSHLSLFVKQFEGRCGEGQFSEMNMVHTKLKEAKDVNIPYIYSVLDDHLASLSESIEKITQSCADILDNEKSQEFQSDFVRCQQAERQEEMNRFIEQQNERRSQVDVVFEANQKIYNTTYRELMKQLLDGEELTMQKRQDFMDLGNEFTCK